MEYLLLTAIEAAVKAGAEIMKIYSKEFDVIYKHDESPITKADSNANTIINSYLKKTNIPVISEENKQTEFKIRSQWNKCWMVDPLDGTKEFIKRNGEFTVNIALIENNVPIMGVIYVPVSKTLYYADVSIGKAYKIKLGRHKYGKGLRKDKLQEMNPLKENSDKTKIVGSRSHNNFATMEFVNKIQENGTKVELLAAGSSLKFCMIADGKAHIYPRFAPTMEWDTAAGHAICNATGFRVMQADNSGELKYNKENLLNPHFLVK